MTDTMSSSTMSSGYDADERMAARQAETLAEEKWRSLCTQHASTFVAAERRASSIKTALNELLTTIVDETKSSAEKVGCALDPEVKYNEEENDYDEKKIHPASGLLADLVEQHKLRRRTLMQHSSLLELLELPSLMDACVRSSLYEDALSIAAFANTLERRHLMDNRAQKQDAAEEEHPQTRGMVVVGVISEIRRREADLRRQLIHRLRGDVTMPQCLEVVTALRRLNGVELERKSRGGKASASNSGHCTTDADYLESVHAAMELRLQVDFLEARDIWLEGGVSKVGSAQAAAVAVASSNSSGMEKGTSAQAEQILDGIERYRTRCFEIVTQFLAIFRGSFTTQSNENDHSHSLLSMWTTRRIQTFLASLNTNIVTHVNDTATLRDALDAASFFASSMSRVGADFQSMLGPIFEPRLNEMVVSHWNDGLNSLTETLQACRDNGVAGPLFGTETSVGKAGEQNGSVDVEEIQSLRTPPPPRKLLSIPPLARLVNAYLTGLNELRRCLLPGAFPGIRLAHMQLIANIKMVLQTNERAVLAPGLRGEATQLRKAASNIKSEFDHCVEPYMSSCLEVALGSLDYALFEAEKAKVTALATKNAEIERLRIEKERDIEKARLAAEAKLKAELEASENEPIDTSEITEQPRNEPDA